MKNKDRSFIYRFTHRRISDEDFYTAMYGILFLAGIACLIKMFQDLSTNHYHFN